MWWIVGAVAWSACGVISYFWARSIMRRWNNQWTTTDRFPVLVYSLLGPVNLLLCAGHEWNMPESNKPAKW